MRDILLQLASDSRLQNWNIVLRMVALANNDSQLRSTESSGITDGLLDLYKRFFEAQPMDVNLLGSRVHIMRWDASVSFPIEPVVDEKLHLYSTSSQLLHVDYQYSPGLPGTRPANR